MRMRPGYTPYSQNMMGGQTCHPAQATPLGSPSCNCSSACGTSGGSSCTESCTINAPADDLPFCSFPPGIAYVPMQAWKSIYTPGIGFSRGTIFEQLDDPFLCTGCPQECRRPGTMAKQTGNC